MFRPLIALLALLSLAAPAVSQSHPGDFVSADARWIAHVDLGGLLRAQLVTEVMKREGVSFDSGEFADMKTALALDPLTDIRSVTVYGTADDPERAVALVMGNVNLENALDRLVLHMQREEITSGGLTMYRWQERDSSSSDELFTYVARRVDSDERVLMAGPNAADVAHAARVVRGDAESLGAGNSRISFAPSTGALIHVTASTELLDSLDVDAPGEVMNMLDSLRLEIGETAGKTYVDARLGVRDSTQAAQVVAIVTGAKAAVELLAASEPEVQQALPLIRALRIENDSGNIHLRLDIANEMLIALMDEHAPVERRDSSPRASEVDYTKPRTPAGEAGSSGWR